MAHKECIGVRRAIKSTFSARIIHQKIFLGMNRGDGSVRAGDAPWEPSNAEVRRHRPLTPRRVSLRRVAPDPVVAFFTSGALRGDGRAQVEAPMAGVSALSACATSRAASSARCG